jgi:hypothetical protein
MLTEKIVKNQYQHVVLVRTQAKYEWKKPYPFVEGLYATNE